MFSLEKIRLRGDRIALFKYLKGCPTEEGQDLFSILPECRIRNHGLKLKEARFRLNIRKNFLTVRTVDPRISRDGEPSSTGGIQEKHKTPGRYTLIVFLH